MADQFPDSHFIGIDASSRQIESGKQLLEQSGLTNVELRYQDILQFSSDEPFDYIICHGVYSWVPDDVKRKILSICRSSLTLNGVAYVSYNTYPYWHMNEIVRDLMMYGARSFDNPSAKLANALRVLKQISTSVSSEFANYKSILARGSAATTSMSKEYYLIHEFLEDVNTPLLFHDFIKEANESGLQYLGEAVYEDMANEEISYPELRLLLNLSSTLTEMEQYRDFLWNRGFRQTLLCHEECKLDRTMPHRRLEYLRVMSNVRTDAPMSELDSKSTVTFVFGDDSKVSTNDPILKSALAQLGRAIERRSHGLIIA